MSEVRMKKREAQIEKIRRAKQRDRTRIVWFIVGFAVIVVGALVASSLIPAKDPLQPEVAITRSLVNDNAVGDPNAPIKIEEFSDFQCPYCARFAELIEPQLVSGYVETGQVYFVYRSFGEFIGPESRASAEASYCAGDQGKFWEMHDLLFANHTGENVGDYTNKNVTAFAETLGLDMGEFTTCFNGGSYSDRVDQDQVDGRAYGVKATPSFVLTYVVNGQTRVVLIEGAQPIAEFQAKIEAALAEMGLK